MFQNFRSNARQFGVAAALLVPMSAAFAAAPDTTAIESSITDGMTGATKVCLAFAAAVLGLRALKLLRKG